MQATRYFRSGILIIPGVLFSLWGCGTAPPDSGGILGVGNGPSSTEHTQAEDTFVDLTKRIRLGLDGVDTSQATFIILGAPQNGGLSELIQQPDRSTWVDYSPARNYIGADSFTYEVSAEGLDEVVRVDVSVLPSVEFSVDVLEGVAPLTVHARAITAQGYSLPQATYHWTFGDVVQEGPLDTHGAVAHTFSQPGVYRITLAIALTGMSQFVGCRRNEDGSSSAEARVQPPPAVSGLSVSPTTGFASSGHAGGPFSPISITYHVENGGDAPLNWRLDHGKSWLVLSSTQGQLAAGASTDVRASIGPDADGLAAGNYQDTLTFVDETAGGSTSRDVALDVTPPVGALSVSPAGAFAASGTAGGPFSPSSMAYQLSNSGGAPISWTASHLQGWLTLSATSGTLNAGESTTVNVSIGTGANSLAAGSYSDTVTFTNSTNGLGNTTRGVGLDVIAPGSLSVSPATPLNASGIVGGPFLPGSAVYSLTNTGGAAINWTAAKTKSWVTLSASGGTLAAGATTNLTVSINSGANALAAGFYSDTVTISNTTNGSGNTTRGVGLTAIAPGGMLVTPGNDLAASGLAGGPFSPSSQVYALKNTGGSIISWTAAKTQSWVTLSPSSGSLAAGATTNVTVSINSNANALAAGSYADTLTFTNTTNGTGNTTRGVGLDVLAPASLSVSPATALSSSGVTGGPFSPGSAVYTLTNSGGVALNWTAAKTQSWVTLSAASGTLGAGLSTNVTVSINSNANALAASSYSDTVTFSNTTNGTGNTTRGVGLNVLAPASLSVSPATALNSSGTAGGPFSPASAVYGLTNTGGVAMNWTATKSNNWVTLSASSGVLAAGATTNVTVSINSNANGLAAGSYSDTVTFTNTTNGTGNTTRGVGLSVLAPAALGVSPATALNSSGPAGGPFSPGSAVYTLSNTGGVALNWTAAKTKNWVTLSASSGLLSAGQTANVTVSINSNANALAAGNYVDTVTFTNSTNGNGNTTRGVGLSVASAGVLSVTPSGDFSSSGPATGPFSPASANYTLTNTGGTAINWTATKGQAWVTLSASSGTLAGGASTTITVSLNANANGLGQGSYSDTVTFTNASNGTGTATRNVSLVVLGGPQMASSVSQYGITWTFDHAYQVGQFVTGDWWVVGPVTITTVSPAPAGSGSAFRHGSMVNPTMAYEPNSTYQAYDGRVNGYNDSYGATYPLTLDPSEGIKSLISVESIINYPLIVADEPNPFPAHYASTESVPSAAFTALRNAAILTVVATPPASNAFRPPFVGTTKPILTTDGIRTNLLPSLTKPSSAPNLADLARCLARPHISVQKKQYVSAYIAPINNEMGYGRDLMNYLGDAELVICCDYTLNQKLPILYGLIQQGIDIYHATLLDPQLFTSNGGYRAGRKLPPLIAGAMLGHAPFLDLSHAVWQEDLNTYYSTDHGPAQTLWTGYAALAKPYTNVGSNNVFYTGAPPGTAPTGDWEGVALSDWDTLTFDAPSVQLQLPWHRNEGYKRLNSYAWIGQALAARILTDGTHPLKYYWAHDAYFDYVDRWMNEDDSANRAAMAAQAVTDSWNTIDTEPGHADWTNAASYYPFGGSALSAFARDMYMAYRSQY